MLACDSSRSDMKIAVVLALRNQITVMNQEFLQRAFWMRRHTLALLMEGVEDAA